MPKRNSKPATQQTAAADPYSEESIAVQPESAGGVPIVGIGASAGGLEAVTLLLKSVSPDTGLGFVLVQHLDPKRESMLAGILSGATRMPVKEVTDNTVVEPNHVYVIPPNSSMILAGGALRLKPREPSAELRTPIDDFLRSLAEDCKNRASAVILSGTGLDGALGVGAVKAEGGITFAQDAKSAKFADMPRNAAATGCIDFVLSPEEIARELARIAQHPYLVGPEVPAQKEPAPGELEPEFQEIFGLLEDRTGVNFSLYRPTTMQRRIRRRLALQNRSTLREYVTHLRENAAETQILYQELLIRVTSFFRNPETFEALKSEIFPQILKNTSNARIRVWAPGCATGEEPYSLAISLLEFLEENGSKAPIQVFASDVNLAAIEQARRGSYMENIAADVTPQRLERWFTATDHRYQVKKEIRDMCVFARHDLIKDPPYSKLDLISCRNVLIYIGATQNRVIPMFHYALKATGFLLLGSAETVGPFPELFSVIDKKNRIYAKNEAMARPLAHYASVSSPGVQDNGVGAGDAPGSTSWKTSDFLKQADRIMLDRYGPAGVIIDPDLQVLETRGDVDPYLKSASGKASLGLLKMVRGSELGVELYAAIRQAGTGNQPVRKERIPVERDGKSREVNIEVFPLPSIDQRAFLILFDDLPPSAPASGQNDMREKKLTADEQAWQKLELENLQLKKELARTREYLLSIVEENAVSVEESQSVQEEAESNIEEMQSVNEELETAKEELQSSNEELITINEELQNRNVELSQARDFSRSIVETVGEPLLVLDTELRIKTANHAFYRFFRTSPDQTEGHLLYRIDGGQWNLSDLRAALDEILPGRRFIRDFAMECEFARIGHKSLLLNASQVEQAQMILLSVHDVSEKKEAERALRQSEEHLRQAQKMEAIGRLAGGVAHDFNNLLTGILGYSDLLLCDLPGGERHRENIHQIKVSAERAAGLTKQLLAFSRRQVLQPVVLNLQTLVADLERMLRRLIGEHIELVIVSDENLGKVRADPGQVGQVIMNLVLNSRDAMPHGGTLTLETRNVDLDSGAATANDLKAGQYVMLQVRDTGIGMDQETQAHIFEPFFTTKGKGLGTGLGLATVFGIAEQSGASIRFASEFSQGTTFQLYLPRIPEPAEEAKIAIPLAAAPGGSEVILLVEDEETVRKLARKFLEARGYTILEARNGAEGLALCQGRTERIHLLLTDVVMPEMGGRELSKQAARLQPQMKVLFMSGYTDDTTVQEGVRVQGIPLLHKPFTLEQLARVVRDTLDGK